MTPHSSEATFPNGGYEHPHDGHHHHNGSGPTDFWSRAGEEAVGAVITIGVALAIDLLERPWRERQESGADRRAVDRQDGAGDRRGEDRGRRSDDRMRRSSDAGSPEPYFGSTRFLWTSIAALGLLSRARRDHAGLRTAAKLALAVATAQTLARATQSWGAGRSPASAGRRIFSERSAAAWAAAGVLEREQGKGPGFAAYSAAALAGSPRISSRPRPVAEAVTGAVAGRLIGRLIGQMRLA